MSQSVCSTQADGNCCEGLSARTPVQITNRPGLSAVAYRVGAYNRFLESMLAKLSSSDYPALQELNTREPSDFSIGILDAWSVASDVLTFYQERIANESYLRTATERQSVLHLARSMGYELNPGVAADTYLSFTLEDTPGAPGIVPLDAGIKVQTVPGPGESPQTFETVEAVQARTEWNALKPMLGAPQVICEGLTELYLKGTNTQLQPGDAILLIGDNRRNYPISEQWDMRVLTSVTTHNDKGCTRVAWEHGLGHDKPTVEPEDNPRVYAFRRRAAVFGHNAPDWRMMPEEIKKTYDRDHGTRGQQRNHWPDFTVQVGKEPIIHLDGLHPEVVVGSWIALFEPNYLEVYRVKSAVPDSRTDYTLTGKTTRLKLDCAEHLSHFGVRETTIYMQSEELEPAETPVTDPVYGSEVTLDVAIEDMAEGRTILVSGKRIRVRVSDTAIRLDLLDGSGSIELNHGDELVAAAAPYTNAQGKQVWQLLTDDGREGLVTCSEDVLLEQPPADTDTAVTETAEVYKSVQGDTETTLVLKKPLKRYYDRATVTIYGNIARATLGDTVNEVLGSGDATKAFQSFTLLQTPLTYIGASVPSGGVSTLKVYVNDVEWHEAPTFFGRGPADRVFVSRMSDAGKVTIRFGDGVTGARLPTGQNNIRAVYRKGTGGSARTDQLSLLMTRPLGVRSVRNPQAASGAQDPESRDSARTNAPLTVLTMDRIVSLRDFEDFSRAFSGIAKALATWVWDGQVRGVLVTVAGNGGQEIEEGSTTHTNLVSALQGGGDPHLHVWVKSFRKKMFKVAAKIQVHKDYLPERVLPAVKKALQTAFSFEQRAFGQPVTLSETMAVMQSVPGVVMVDVDELYRQDMDDIDGKIEPLPAYSPQAGEDIKLGAELLVLDTSSLDSIEVKS